MPFNKTCINTRPEVEARNPPAYLTAELRRKFLHSMVEKLPENMQDKIVVLKNIQLDCLKIEEEFVQQMYDLEAKYRDKLQPLLDKRMEIVTGQVDPPKENPKWPQVIQLQGQPCSQAHNQQQQYSAIEARKIAATQNIMANVAPDCRGIPNFWLTVLKNTKSFAALIHAHDEPALKHLTDICVTYDKLNAFTLEFHFSSNEYFSNSVLTRQYFLKTCSNSIKPFNFDGCEIYKTKGHYINWHHNMNLTIKQPDKDRGDFSFVVNNSFFDMFCISELEYKHGAEHKELRHLMEADCELAHLIRDKIVPHAVLYFTGDIVDDEENEKEFVQVHTVHDNNLRGTFNLAISD